MITVTLNLEKIASCGACSKDNYISTSLDKPVKYLTKEVPLFRVAIKTHETATRTQVLLFCGDCLKELRAKVFPFSN